MTEDNLEELDDFYNHVRNSFEVAMRSENIDKDKMEEVLLTVDDCVGNY